MLPINFTTDASGYARIAVAGYGFLIKPAGDTPGYFPITVLADTPTGDRRIPLREPREVAQTFAELRIEDAPASSTFVAYIANRPGEKIGDSSAKQFAMPLASSGAENLLTADPSGTNGWEILPNQTGWTFFFAGTLRDSLQLWQRDPDGNWFNTGDTIDATTETVAARTTLARKGRVALKDPAGAGGPTVRVYRHIEEQS